MRGTRSLLDMGLMSPQMRRLAKGQDKIGWRIFVEGRIFKELFEIQGVYLALGCHKLNGEQWVKQCRKNTPHHPQPMDIQELHTPRQTKRMAEKEGHEGHNGKNRKSVGH